MEVIALLNQKGGVGKTTTAAALGAGLTRAGYKVLLIDLDAQGNLTSATGASSTGTTALEVLTRKAKAQDAIQDTPQGAIIAAGAGLAAEGILTATGKEYRLREAMEPIKKRYDYILIDCPPSLGILTINALTAATSCIIPAQADIFSLQAVGQFSQTLDAIRQYTNPALSLKGILITRYSGRAVLRREISELLQDAAAQLNTRVFDTRIRECIAIGEAQTVKQDIYSYAPRSNAAADYTAFTQEVIEGSKS